MGKRLRRPIAPLDLSTEEEAYLERQVRRHLVPRSFSDRYRIILRCPGGVLNKTVVAELGAYEPSVGKSRRRFLNGRVEGPFDAERFGSNAFSVPAGLARSRTIENDQVAEVIERALATAPKDETHWSIRSMAKETDLSHTTIRRIRTTFLDVA